MLPWAHGRSKDRQFAPVVRSLSHTGLCMAPGCAALHWGSIQLFNTAWHRGSLSPYLAHGAASGDTAISRPPTVAFRAAHAADEGQQGSDGRQYAASAGAAHMAAHRAANAAGKVRPISPMMAGFLLCGLVRLSRCRVRVRYRPRLCVREITDECHL